MEAVTVARARLFAVFLLAFVLQATVGKHGRFLGTHLDFFLILALSAALLVDHARSLPLALVLGFFADAFLGGPVGVAALTFSVWAYIVGTFRRKVTPSVGLSATIGSLASAGAVLTYVMLGRFLHTVDISFAYGFMLAIVSGALHGLVIPVTIRLLTAYPRAPRDASWL